GLPVEIVVAIRAVPVDRLGVPRRELIVRGLTPAEQNGQREKGCQTPFSGKWCLTPFSGGGRGIDRKQTGHGRSLHVCRDRITVPRAPGAIPATFLNCAAGPRRSPACALTVPLAASAGAAQRAGTARRATAP